MNMRDFWAAEAANIRDTSHLGIPNNDYQPYAKFGENVVESANRIFRNVKFGSNAKRNKKRLFDTRYWELNGEITLKMKKGILPTTALKSLMDNTSRNLTLDCAQFVQVAYLGAIMLTDEEPTFDKMIDDIFKRTKEIFTLRSFNSTGVETEVIYSRIDPVEKFTFNDDPDNRTLLSQEELLKNAPIGSRITVANFRIGEYESGSSAQKAFAYAIRDRGWANENMIKIGDDSYAAFGISPKATLAQVRNALVNENYRGQRPTQAQKEELLQKIQVSHVEHFKRK